MEIFKQCVISLGFSNWVLFADSDRKKRKKRSPRKKHFTEYIIIIDTLIEHSLDKFFNQLTINIYIVIVFSCSAGMPEFFGSSEIRGCGEK